MPSARRSAAGLAKRPRAPRPAAAGRTFPPRVATPQQRDADRAARLLAARTALPAAPHDDLGRRGFTLASLNCCGIRSAERRGLLRWLKRQHPDVLCLQEVRAWPEQVSPELRCPAGYNSRWLVCGKKGYAGVATYSRPSPDGYVVGSGCGDLSWGDEEARVLRTDFGGLSVYNLYLPSGSNSADRQLLKFEYLEHFLPTAKRCSQHQCLPMSGAVFHDPCDTGGLPYEHDALSLTPSLIAAETRGPAAFSSAVECKGGHP